MAKKLKRNSASHDSASKKMQRKENATYSEVEACETSDVKELREWFRALQSSIGVGVLLLALYVKTLYPSVPGGDSGELIISANELGSAHPPGYPLFTMMSKAMIELYPGGGNVAWKVNVLNAFLSAVAGALLNFTMMRLTHSLTSGLVAVAMFSLSRLTWTWSVSAEVFGLNNFFVALIVLLAALFYQNLEDEHYAIKCSCYGALVCGLSLCNQHTIVIYVACIIIWVWWQLYTNQLLTVTLLIQQGMWFAVGISPYLYLPIASYLNIARWTWGDQSSWSGFLTHVLRHEYGTFNLGKDSTGLGLLFSLRSYGEHVASEMSMYGVMLTLAGCVFVMIRYHSCERYLSLYRLYITMFLCYTLFFSWRANLDISNPLFMGVVERFWMQSNFVVAIFAGLGFHEVSKLALSRVAASFNAGEMSESKRSEIAVILSASLIVLQLITNYKDCNMSDNTVIRDFGEHLLDNMPSNALVLTKGDLPTNSMRYLHLCEGMRPDLKLLDVEILSYRWSLPMLRKFYPDVTFPADFWHLHNAKWQDGSESFDFKTFLDVNYDKYPILVCIGMQEKDNSWESSYQMWPFSVCHRIISAGTPLNPAMWEDMTSRLPDTWKYPHTGFDERSWEKVANDEIWNSKVSTAYFMYQQATQLEDKESKTQLYYASYKGYKSALEKNSEVGFPVFWHKNYALVCERLMHMETDLSEIELCEESIQHFQIYMDRNPRDSDIDNIRQASLVLKERLKTFKKFKEANERMAKHGFGDP